MGPARAPRHRLHPGLSETIHNHPTPAYQLGRQAGWAHGREVSYLTQPGAVIVATPRTVNRIKLLASIVGWPADRIFMEDGPR